MKINPPLLSVVIPSYNQGMFIGDNLKELAKYDEIEIIVMDGGSTDETCDVIRSFEKSIDYWVSERDDGQAHAINKGFARATGQWIAFQNSDDYYVEGALEEVLDTMRRNPETDMLVGGCLFVEVDGKPFRSTLPRPIWPLLHARMNFLQNQALFVRRDFAEKVGPLRNDAQFCLDYEWFLRLLRKKPRIELIQRHVGAQRYHENTKSSNIKPVHDAEFAKFSRLHFNWLERAMASALLPIYRGYRLAKRL